jgi:hypothetical protein
VSEQPTVEQDIEQLNLMVRALSPVAQARVWIVYDLLNGMLDADESGEVELAFTLVMTEIAK